MEDFKDFKNLTSIPFFIVRPSDYRIAMFILTADEI